MRRLLILTLTLLMVSCMAPPGTGPILHGKISVAALKKPKAGLKTAMLPADIVADATVSLVAADNSTAAVGLTDGTGAFTLTVPAPTNGLYQLIASKRAGGDGRLLHLTTLVNYNNGTWTSVTQSAPDVVINPTTTAVVIVAGALGVNQVDWLNKVTLDGGTNEYTVVSPSLVSPTNTPLAATVDLIGEHVATLVDLDVDPLRGVCFVGTATSDGAAPVGAATSGATLVKVTGFGFDPVSERNSIGFQVGRQFYWTQALPGGNETTLTARMPAIPPVDLASGATTTAVHVRNGVGALEVNIDAAPTMALQTPRAVPDTVASLPDSFGAPRFASMAVGPLSGFVNWTWPDERFNSLSPILRIWNLTSNVLAATPPQVANSTAPDVAADPGFFPQTLVKETAAAGTTPMQIQTSVIWQGKHTQSGNNAIFHRTALNGSWLVYNGPGGPSASASVATIAGGTNQDDIAPAAVMDSARIFVAYGDRYTAGRYNLKVRLWNGTFRNNVPDWALNSLTGFLTANGSNATTVKFPQAAVSANGPGGISFYHALWLNADPTFPSGGSLQYRRGFANAGFTSLSWDPPTSTNQPATFQDGVGDISDLTFTADTAGNLLAVWLLNGQLTAKAVTADTATTAFGNTTMTPPPLPAGAVESSPRVVAVAPNDFYLISASTTANDPEAASEIWLRRCNNNTWTGPVKLSASPGVPSLNPLLHWNGSTLTAGWQEGATMVYELVIMPI
jgi:hypothetical protein